MIKANITFRPEQGLTFNQ